MAKFFFELALCAVGVWIFFSSGIAAIVAVLAFFAMWLALVVTGRWGPRKRGASVVDSDLSRHTR